jgi:broad specificity phosphatase PhoE
MLQIALVRPGSTDYDAQQRIQGSLDIPLNEQGTVEAAETAEELRPWAAESVYAPGSQPSWQTAQIIAQTLGIKSKKLDRLKNLHMGLWEGMLVEDVRRKQPKVYRQWQEQPECVCPPEGEMLSAADERLRAAIIKLIKKHDDGVIALVLPEPLMSLARRFLGHVELGDLWKAPNGHARIESFTIDAEEFLATGVGSE